MTVDSTLAFAQRRNVPVRYNRELVAKTLQAMARVQEIRSRRELAFYRQRMKGVKERELEADRKLVVENQHLLPPQYRDQVKEVLEAQTGVLDAEMETEELEEEVNAVKQKHKSQLKAKGKQRVRRDGVVEDEEMEVDV